MSKYIEILGIRIDKTSFKDATKTIFDTIQKNEKAYLTTPNPEIILKAQKNNEYKKVINNSILNIPDGIGLLWASKFLKITENNKSKIIIFLKFLFSSILTLFYPKYIKTELPERVTGSDLFLKTSKIASEKHIKIFLLGSENGVDKKCKMELEKMYKNINIVGTYEGNPNRKNDKNTQNLINKTDAQILFVAYGAPNQEFWIDRNLTHLKNINIAIGVGGSFDFIAKIKKRAPKIMQSLSLEWLFRIIQEPKRIKRIINAVIIFPICVLKTKFKNSKINFSS